MLKRLYVDGFRCLVNFEIKLDHLALFLGENGAGKTTVFDVLSRLQQFLLGWSDADGAFPLANYTRWQARLIQRFELDLQLGTDLYQYKLAINLISPRSAKSSVQSEGLSVNDRLVFSVEEGSACIADHEGKLGEKFPFDPVQSVVGSFLQKNYVPSLSAFKREIAKFVICSQEPMRMSAKSEKEIRVPARNMEDFASWYRYLSQEYQGAIFHLTNELRAALPDFHSFRLTESGENARTLMAYFQSSQEDTSQTSYRFDELSDGQRVLIVLYTLLYGLQDRGAYLFLDEPENFVALREIQPWLAALTDQAGNAVRQAVLISHHPEVINYLGASNGRWFSRAANGPVRVADQPSGEINASLPLSESVARGWEK